MNLTGNLSPSDSGPLADTLTSSEAYTAGGAAATGTTLLNSLDGRQAAYQSGDTFRFQERTPTGRAVNTSFAVSCCVHHGRPCNRH